WVRCGLCAGVPARSTVRRVRWSVWIEDVWSVAPAVSGGIGGGFLGGAPARCSRSDGRMIYGVNEAISGMMLRRLEKSRVV
ncbi:unnamed protein product, partial [Prunus brigantina]